MDEKMEDRRRDLLRRIGDFLFASYRWTSMDNDGVPEPKALGLNIDLLEYQRLYHPLYGKYCALHGRTSRGVSLLDYPPLPVECFKRADVCPFDVRRTVAEFRSSGTTEGTRSVHRFRDLGLYQRSMLYAFTALIAGKFAPESRMLSLMPSYADNPHSSLGYMLSRLTDLMGEGGSGCYFSMERGLDVEGLCAQLEEASSLGHAVHLMGPSFAYVELLDRLGERRFASAPGSTLLETGGYKGRSREIPRGELRDMLADRLGIARRFIYGEYGMCELSSQGYEICAITTEGELPDEGLYIFPGWVKCVVYNPETMAPVLPGNAGQIAIFDLCNLDSAAYVLTGDVGVLEPLDGPLRKRVPGHPRHALRLMGRAASAVPKGCSMAWEEWARGV